MTPKEKLGKAAYDGYVVAVSKAHPEFISIPWDEVALVAKTRCIAAAEAAVEADALDRMNQLFCAEHFNQAERGEVPRLEKCIVCIRDDMNAHRQREQNLRDALTEVRDIMADPRRWWGTCPEPSLIRIRRKVEAALGIAQPEENS